MIKNESVKIGTRLKAARKAKHMTQEELAYAVDMTAAYIEMIERGQRSPKFETFLDIIEAMIKTS